MTMIKHIVMFKFKNSDNIEKQINAEKLKTKLENLPTEIVEIKSFEIGLNYCVSPNAYDMVLISTFENREHLQEYAKHLEHIKVLNFIDEIVQSRVVVDFEL